MKTANYSSLQHGISLLESLIAILVMAIGILGILGVQMRTLSDTQTGLNRAQAIRLIEDLQERLMANPNAFQNTASFTTNWTQTPNAATNCNTSACNHQALAEFDRQQWKAQVVRTLPNGDASVFISQDETQITNRRQLGVMLSWRENESSNDGDYKNPINASTQSGDIVSCPSDQNCHLQFIPIMARCAPYLAGTSMQFFCSGS